MFQRVVGAQVVIGTAGLVEDLDIAVAFVQRLPGKIRDGPVDNVPAGNQLGRIGMEGAGISADLGASHIRRRDREVDGAVFAGRCPLVSAFFTIRSMPSLPIFLPIE
jgi:hypothetical protein